jgi:hypothetical protein
MIFYRGFIAVLLATWGLFAFAQEPSEKEPEAVVRDSVRAPITAPAPTVPPTTNGYLDLTFSTQPAPPVQPDPKRFLTTAFVFNQRGVEVSDLQQLLGVKADGWYGQVTRNAHYKYLVEAKLPTDVVPSVPASSRSPRSGYKFVEWNGDVAEIPVDATKRCPQYEAKFVQHGLPVEIFSFIAWRESRCNPKAENWTLNANGTSDHGLVQINSSWKTVTSQTCGSKMGDLTVLLEVDCNLKVAKRLLEISSNPLGNWNL